MTDDPNKKGRQDRSRINLSERYEVDYWMKKFGISEHQLEAAVKAVGSSAELVEQHLKIAKG
jgi:hypothetical protein